MKIIKNYSILFCLILMVIALFFIEKELSKDNLGGAYGETSYSSASTTPFSITTSQTVLSARPNRGCFILSNNSAFSVYYRLDATSATVNNGILLVASTTHTYSETIPYRGAVTAMGQGGTASLLVTECIY